MLIAIGGMPDHVHLVARVPTNLSVADAVRTIKANSSKWINRREKGMRFGWQRGYGAFSVSESQTPRVVQYVREQERHHRGRSFEQELESLLAANRIEIRGSGLTR